MQVPITATSLLEQINRRHGVGLMLLERYQQGEQGAFELADQRGDRYVLKWSMGDNKIERLRLAGAVTERLRSLGYPAPRYCFVGNIAGASYSIQEALPGVPLGRCTPELLPRLLDLNTLQVGQALSMPRNWPAPVVKTVLHGGDGFCLLETMRAYSSTTSELLDVLQRVVTAYADTPIATDDIVHIDFNPANILVDDGQISGVVDWEDAHAGDCTFDLATLLFYSYDIAALREPLQRLALDRAGPNALRMYLAHMILRQVEWSARHHARATVDNWLGIAGLILRDWML
jgi:hypothetical protein